MGEEKRRGTWPARCRPTNAFHCGMPDRQTSVSAVSTPTASGLYYATDLQRNSRHHGVVGRSPVSDEMLPRTTSSTDSERGLSLLSVGTNSICPTRERANGAGWAFTEVRDCPKEDAATLRRLAQTIERDGLLIGRKSRDWGLSRGDNRRRDCRLATDGRSRLSLWARSDCV